MNRGVYSRTVVDAAEDGRAAWRWLALQVAVYLCRC